MNVISSGTKSGILKLGMDKMSKMEKEREKETFRDPKLSIPKNFNRYDFSVLKNVWSIETSYTKVLTKKQTFITDITTFFSKVEKQCYPRTYEDIFHPEEGDMEYYISYIFTSYPYLYSLQKEFPNYTLVYQLRLNEHNNLRQCLVRKWDKFWDREKMVESGWIEE